MFIECVKMYVHTYVRAQMRVSVTKMFENLSTNWAHICILQGSKKNPIQYQWPKWKGYVDADIECEWKREMNTIDIE